jgi:hypothetical protein
MKRVTYSGTRLLMGDDAADVLLRYASSLANVGRADTVAVRAIAATGCGIDVTLLLDTGTVLMAEDTESGLAVPDNSGVVTYMRERMRGLEQPLRAVRLTTADTNGNASRYHLE